MFSTHVVLLLGGFKIVSFRRDLARIATLTYVATSSFPAFALLYINSTFAGCDDRAIQDLGLAPDTPTTVYVTDGSGERRLLQLTPSGEDEPAPELTVKGVYGRYDGIGVDARLVFGGRNAATTGLQFIEMLTTRPQAFAPAFKELGAVRFLFGAEAGHRASLDTPLLEPQMTVDETPVAAPTPADPPARAAPFPPLTDMQHCR